MGAFVKLGALLLLGAAASVQAYSIPSNLQTIYANHKPGKCANNLQGGFMAKDGSTDKSFCYCGDLSGAIYLHSQHNGGQYADMDIDCDGANNKDGKCANDQSGKGITAFQTTVQNYDAGILDLEADIIPYVVLGNSGGSPSYDPQSYGVKPLSVVAVICNNQLHYAIWGDTNGGTLVGEASMALGDLCFPNENLSGDNGHDGLDVMYIAFQGAGAVPGKTGAAWNAQSSNEFEGSIKKLGDKLVAGLK